MKVAVFGATGQVGTLMRKLLQERSFPVSSMRFFASPNSAGTKLPFLGEKIVVEDACSSSFSGIELALMSIGADASKEIAPKIAAQGAIVIDNSRAFRMDPEVPLVVAGVNDEDLASIPKGIIANPNCTTMIAMPAVKPLHDEYRLKEMFAASYQAASGAGRAGLAELKAQALFFADKIEELAFSGWRLDEPKTNVFSKHIAFSVIPAAGSYQEHEETSEEVKLREESRKILHAPGLRVTATCVRVGVAVGHSIALTLDFESPPKLASAKELVGSAPGVRLVELPTPFEAAGADEVLVGRIRLNPDDPCRLSLFVCGDNLRKGAALNAVQIAELLLKKRLIG